MVTHPSSDNIWNLPENSTDAKQELMTVGKHTGKLQQVWFSTSGTLAFAWFSLPGNLHKVKVWDVANPLYTCVIDHQIVSEPPEPDVSRY